jgi:hypothetical protein
VGDVTGEFEVKALYAKKTPYFVVAELYHKGCFESFSVPLVAGFEFNCTYTDRSGLALTFIPSASALRRHSWLSGETETPFILRPHPSSPTPFDAIFRHISARLANEDAAEVNKLYARKKQFLNPAFTVRNRRYRIAQVLPLKIEEAIL